MLFQSTLYLYTAVFAAAAALILLWKFSDSFRNARVLTRSQAVLLASTIFAGLAAINLKTIPDDTYYAILETLGFLTLQAFFGVSLLLTFISPDKFTALWKQSLPAKIIAFLSVGIIASTPLIAVTIKTFPDVGKTQIAVSLLLLSCFLPIFIWSFREQKAEEPDSEELESKETEISKSCDAAPEDTKA